jgi:phosphatidylglycerol---prolipoprotein diacylglyceryl transferase
MLVHNLNPDIISFGNIAIKWYGVFYVIGFAFAIWYFRKFSNLDKEDVYDFFTYLIIGAIGGARLFYVAVYNLSFYLSNPLKIFAVWEGGMSFHGGLLGAFLIGWWFCKKKDISFYYLADLAVIPLALALGLGRIGNFINGEL